MLLYTWKTSNIGIFTPMVPCWKGGENVVIFRCTETKLLIWYQVTIICYTYNITHLCREPFCVSSMIEEKSLEDCVLYEKKEEIWLSPVTKTPTPIEQSKKQRENIKTPPKTLITQLLRTDLGRSVGVTAVDQLVWLNRFTSAQPSQ